ncbi:hypothetical protein GF358_00580 [Candidatus Woesearchaeota archaeon]|nr:hypothetical protein [Candidatus Woesearchaeota archaeon]
MGINTTRIVKEENKKEFRQILKNKHITVSSHAYDHLSTAQRKLFKDEELINPVIQEQPRKVFLQANKRYALYYRKRKEYLKIILEIENNTITIVSFMNVQEIPRIK